MIKNAVLVLQNPLHSKLKGHILAGRATAVCASSLHVIPSGNALSVFSCYSLFADALSNTALRSNDVISVDSDPAPNQSGAGGSPNKSWFGLAAIFVVAAIDEWRHLLLRKLFTYNIPFPVRVPFVALSQCRVHFPPCEVLE